MADGDAGAHDWEAVLGSLKRSQHLKYVNASVLMYIVVDFIQTFPDEVIYMWGSPWSLAKGLFYLTRYLPFVDLPLMIFYNEARGLAPGGCHFIFGLANVVCVSATGIAESLMFMRVHALSKQSPAVRRYLIVHYAIVQSACIALALYYIQSISFASPFPVLGEGPCIPYAFHEAHLSAIFALVFFNQLTITALSVYFVLVNFRESKGPLIRMLWKDGVYYFILMSSITIANFIMSIRAPMEYKYLLAQPQRMLHATVATRMVLRMRRSARLAHDFFTQPLSTIRFQEISPKEHVRCMGSMELSHKATSYSSALDETSTTFTTPGAPDSSSLHSAR